MASFSKSALKIIALALLFFSISCSKSWTKVIAYGNVLEQNFKDSVSFETQLGLMILPVTIKGKSYRFLFDSGAPTSISKELNTELDLPQISKGRLMDSDKNVTSLKFLEIDTFFIASIPFYNQSAFVGDFKANPILDCLELDGIIGSNTQRFCNWKINNDKKNIILSKETFDLDSSNYTSLPFSYNIQFDMQIDLKTPKGKINNIKVDYGSNSALSIPKSLFDEMLELEMISEVFSEEGYSQSGIVGSLIEKNVKIANIDSLLINDVTYENVVLRSGGSGLLGNQFLSRQEVIIDWSNEQIHFENESLTSPWESFGLSCSESDSLGVFIKSIIVDGPAYNSGIEVLMKVKKLNHLNFDKGADLCDYISAYKLLGDSINITTTDSVGNEFSSTLEKVNLFKTPSVPPYID